MWPWQKQYGLKKMNEYNELKINNKKTIKKNNGKSILTGHSYMRKDAQFQ